MSVAPKVLTLLMVVRDGRVLLGHKKRGFGAGFYNGFGGKVEPGESVDEAALGSSGRRLASTPSTPLVAASSPSSTTTNRAPCGCTSTTPPPSPASPRRRTRCARSGSNSTPCPSIGCGRRRTLVPDVPRGEDLHRHLLVHQHDHHRRHELREVNATQLEAEAAAPSRTDDDESRAKHQKAAVSRGGRREAKRRRSPRHAMRRNTHRSAYRLVDEFPAAPAPRFTRALSSFAVALPRFLPLLRGPSPRAPPRARRRSPPAPSPPPPWRALGRNISHHRDFLFCVCPSASPGPLLRPPLRVPSPRRFSSPSGSVVSAISAAGERLLGRRKSTRAVRREFLEPPRAHFLVRRHAIHLHVPEGLERGGTLGLVSLLEALPTGGPVPVRLEGVRDEEERVGALADSLAVVGLATHEVREE